MTSPLHDFSRSTGELVVGSAFLPSKPKEIVVVGSHTGAPTEEIAFSYHKIVFMY